MEAPETISCNNFMITLPPPLKPTLKTADIVINHILQQAFISASTHGKRNYRQGRQDKESALYSHCTQADCKAIDLECLHQGG